MMKYCILSWALAATFIFSSYTNKHRPKVLIFAKTAGYHHSSIVPGIEAIKKIGAENGFVVDVTTDSSLFTDRHLKQYSALIFLSTTGNLFDSLQKEALQKYIHHGGGLIGVHAATDCEYKWPWYGKMIGAYFESHPAQQTARLNVVDPHHASTQELPQVWTRFDEWYNFKNLNPDVHVLLKIDETSYTGGKNGENHPMAWWQDFEGGRIFYTELGHTDASYSEPLYLKHLTGGILFVLNRKKQKFSEKVK